MRMAQIKNRTLNAGKDVEWLDRLYISDKNVAVCPFSHQRQVPYSVTLIPALTITLTVDFS